MFMSVSDLIFEVQSTIEDIQGLNECQRCNGTGFIDWSSMDHSVCWACNMLHEHCEQCSLARRAVATAETPSSLPYTVLGDAADISAATEADDYDPFEHYGTMEHEYLLMQEERRQNIF